MDYRTIAIASKAEDQDLSRKDGKEVYSDDYVIVECPLCKGKFPADLSGNLDDHILQSHAEVINGTLIQPAFEFDDSTIDCEMSPEVDEKMNSDLDCCQTASASPLANSSGDIGSFTKSVNNFNCPLCSYTNISAQVMARHIIDEHSSNHGIISNNLDPNLYSDHLPFTNSECSSKLKTFESLQCRMLREQLKLKPDGRTSMKIHQCSECPRIFKRKSYLTEHFRVHTGERPFPCSECSYKAKRKKHLKMHINNKHRKKEVAEKPKKTYRCPDCPNVYENAGKFLMHTYTHSGDRPFKCSVCGHRTRRAHELKIHMTMHQDDGGGKYESRAMKKCPHCRYTNFLQSKLTEHIKLHDGEHPYECDKCDYKAKTEEHLICHKTIHQNGKFFKCSECEFATNNENTFSNHLKCHTGEQKYCCQECRSTFKYSLSLKQHMANVHNLKPLKCPEPNCDFATAVKFSYESHLKLHLGEPKQMCGECGHKCHTSKQLSKHEAAHYGKGPFKCPDCAFVSVHKASIRRHRKEGGRGNTCVRITASDVTCP